MARATTDVILVDAIDATTIAVETVDHVIVDTIVITHRIATMTVAVHPIADVVRRHQDSTITVATTF